MKREDYAEFLEGRNPNIERKILNDYLWSEELKRRKDPRMSKKHVKMVIMFGVAILVLIAIMIWADSANGQAMPQTKAAAAGFYATTPNAKVPRLDWKFGALAGAVSALSIWDVAQTQGCLAHVPGCRESNPVYGPHPGPARQYATSLAIDGAYALASYELRRHGPKPIRKLWPAPIAWAINGHIQAIAGSVHH